MTLRVCRAVFSIDDPWSLPTEAERVPLRKATDGSPARLPTTVAAYADDECVNVLFHARDDEIVATYLRHDEPLYDEDVVEVFLAPQRPESYFEIEVNPLGTTFDARIESPDGARTTMRMDRGWHCRGLFAAIRRTPQAAETIIRIPFADLGARRPSSGETWRANFFRIDRSPAHGDEFSAWQPTMRVPADFHVTAAFGNLLFE